MVGRVITYKVVKKLKEDKILELPWDCFKENEFLYLFENNSCVCAVIGLSIDPYDNNVIWIDEFEIVSNYRKQGIGKLIICDFLEECDNVVKLMAKNEEVAKFWYECGFQYDNPSGTKIPMIFSKQR